MRNATGQGTNGLYLLPLTHLLIEALAGNGACEHIGNGLQKMHVIAREPPLCGRVGTEHPKGSVHTLDNGTHAAHDSIVLHLLWLEACFCAQIIHHHGLSDTQRIASRRIGLHTQRCLANQLLRESHSRAYTECTPIWEEIEDSTIVDAKRLSHTAHHLVYEYSDVGIVQRTLSQSRNHGLLQGM